ncbi:MAG TPA: hypothetical protein PKD90_05750, partial [Phnomibacter sp.]|nr:hypothetical protein [Phnomibacter sp.]
QGTEEGTYTFTGYPATEDTDPFSPEANRWRIPPAQPESLEDIRQRVLDFLVFQRNWYAFVLQHKMDPILINWYPNPMLMHYANGVRMAYADELDSWNRCFYDSTAAVRGYQFIGGGLREVTIKKTDNKVERNLDCLKQMIDAIRTQEILKEPTPEATTN